MKSFLEWLNENKGINPAVYKHLKKCLKKNPKATKKEAEEYIQKQKGLENWKLSDDDYEEAKN